MKNEISGDEKSTKSWLGCKPKGAFKDVEVIYRNPSNFDGETGIISVTISTPNGEVVPDKVSLNNLRRPSPVGRASLS